MYNMLFLIVIQPTRNTNRLVYSLQRKMFYILYNFFNSFTLLSKKKKGKKKAKEKESSRNIFKIENKKVRLR